MRLRSLVIAAILGLSFTAVPSHAAVEYIVAGGGSQASSSYATPVVFAPVGGPLTFMNGDVQPHSVVSDAFGPGTQAWCGFFETGKCPLIWSPVTDAGFRTSTVLGLDKTTSGTSYTVHCVIHPQVRGTIVTL